MEKTSVRLLITAMAVVAVVQGAAWGLPDFELTGTQSLIVTGDHLKGVLYDNSSVDIQSGGYVDQLSAYNDSSLTLSGGSVYDLYTDNSSDVDISGSSVTNFFATGSSTVNISGGFAGYLMGYGTSEIKLIGGEIAYLDVGGFSQTTFYGYGWSAAGGLSIVGDELIGTGILDGFWADGTAWSTEIAWNDDTATIILDTISEPVPIPAPGAFLLGSIGVGFVSFLRKQKTL